MIICIFTGFSSGLPFFVTIQLLQVWLRDNGIGRAEIGLLSLVGIPYVLKFLWAPLMDRYVPPLFGRRRGWMLLMQLACLGSIALLGSIDPTQSLYAVAYVALALSFFSASQDIVLDAYRREILPDRELGLGNSIHVQAYRIAGLIPGSLALILADFMPWVTVFWVVAGFMLVGVLMTVCVKEPELLPGAKLTIRQALVEPFKEFFTRKGWRAACWVLAFMFLYKIGDSMATALSSVFYLDLGFSKTQIGIVAKNAALWSSIIGGLLGGLLMIRIGINRALWLFGVVQLLSILGFALLSSVGASLWLLAAVISFEYFGVGLGSAAFIAFIARETDRRYAATQLALLTALTAIPRTFANASTGVIVESVGWTPFFLLCAVIAVPGMILLVKVAPWGSADR
ncbi:MAG: AmpG family muropeptide MFS transporter [Spongiibacteraceae bacterium]|nr:AmpG family muropeptide MFS transporter [Spongiibacteraceae bacterium]